MGKAVHPTDPNRVYFARYWDVALSADGGNTLTVAAPFPDGGARPISLYVSAAGAIYAGTLERGAFVSTDNGASWTPWGLNSASPRAVLAIAYSPAGGGVFFMATTDGLYRRASGGAWTRLDASNPGYSVGDLAVDPSCPHRLYAAQGFVGTLGVHRGGITMSEDNGDTWTSITSGLDLHQAPIADVEVDAGGSHNLYAAVYGQGMWELDWGNPRPCPPLLSRRLWLPRALKQ